MGIGAMVTKIRLLTVFLLQFFLVNSLIAGEKVDQNIDLGGSRSATWYLPDTTPGGWVLLQHGFQRNKNNLDDLATHLMDSGIMVLTINSNVTGGNSSLATDVADDLIDNPPVPPNGFSLPDNLVIAGHSAGGLFVSYMGGRLVERGFTNVRGAILFDPVDADDGMQSNLQSMIDSNKSVLSILANSSSCNSSNNALTPLRALSDSFVGIKLTDNSKHTDVEGSSSGGIITWICGTPQTHNIAYLKDFTLHWVQDMLQGTYAQEYYPGGSVVQQLLADNDGVLIKELVTLPPTANFSFSVMDLTVAFSDNSSDGDGEIVTYDWQFGDSQSSELENPTHTYDSAGTYTVTLTVTDSNGQTGSRSKNVTVAGSSSAPNAAFSFTTEGLTVSYTDNSDDSDGTIISHSWSFGDGNTSNEANPTHTYSEAGSYSVTLQVVDNDGLIDSVTEVVDVFSDDGLENGARIENLSASQGEALYFKMNVPTGATDLEFAISDGTGDADIYVRYGAVPTTTEYDYRPYENGNNETVNVANPQGGEWHLMIRAYRTFAGVTLTASYTAPGNQAPIADFNSNIQGLSVDFIDASSDSDGNIVSWLWTFGDGNQSSLQSPTHTFSASGSYNVTLAVEDNEGATNSTSKTILVADGDLVVEIQNGETISDLSESTGGELHFVLRDVPAETAELIFSIAGGTGDADIYVRHGQSPTQTEYDYRPYLYGNDETVAINNATQGDWYVMVRAYQAFSGVALTASHTVN